MSNPTQSDSLAVSLVTDHQGIRRTMAVVGLAGIALIHLLDLEEKLEEAPFIGILFIVLIVASLVMAEALTRTDDARTWMVVGVVAAATMIAYALSRSVGLPGEGGEEIGKWTEPLGLASLLVEGIVVWLAASRVLLSQR